jgi:hypothetical protein
MLPTAISALKGLVILKKEKKRKRTKVPKEKEKKR